MNIEQHVVESIEFEVSEVYEKLLTYANTLPKTSNLRSFLVRQQDRLGTALDHIEQIYADNKEE